LLIFNLATLHSCNDNFNVTQFSQVAASDDNFRAALRNAFLCCAVDSRRFPFMARFYTMEQDSIDSINHNNSNNKPQEPNKNAPNALLMLFLELMNFSDLHGVTPASRRRQVAQRIALKFFLPTKVGTGPGAQLEPPMFDFHHIVSDTVLRQLESNLNNPQADVPQDLFLEFQHAVVDALCGTTFLLFLVSNHCARMRGYLRNVAPFVNVPLKPVFDALLPGEESPTAMTTIHSGAKNYFLYVLIYLMQLEKDPTATLSTDGSTLLGRNGRRMVGAAGGICCFIFIGRNVLPAMKNFQKQQQQTDGASSSDDRFTALVGTFGQLWEIFVAPGVGALEHAWKSKETKEHLEVLRSTLRAIRKDVLGKADVPVEQRVRLFAERFASDPKLLKELQDLNDQLLYDHGIHQHQKFREHIFHEWMCSELAKGRKKQLPEISQAEEEKEEQKDDAKDESTEHLPALPSGSIKRLLRKVDLPVGVSPHKPIHSGSSSGRPTSEKRPETNSQNADCAIIFGSSVGADLSLQMMSPAMDKSDIRRYTCQDVTVDGEKLPDTFEDEMIPPTLESYAALPPTRATGFSEVTGNVALRYVPRIRVDFLSCVYLLSCNG